MFAGDQRTLALFQTALGIHEPWYIAEYSFDAKERKLNLHIDFKEGARFDCPQCGAPGAKPYDTAIREWRHLNFFEHSTTITARVPRVECSVLDCPAVKTITVPWAAKGSRFTLLFEAYIMTLASEMPIKAIADLVGEYDQRIWTIVHRNVEEALALEDHSTVTKIGLDETASRRGHNYITVFVDLDEKKALFATEGKSAATVGIFVDDLLMHGGDPKNIEAVSLDMSPAFISGAQMHLPDASLVFDKFHVMKLMGDAVDEVRREEAKTTDVLKKTRYLWLKNPDNLSNSQAENLISLSKLNLQTARAYQIRLSLAEFFRQLDSEAAEAYLRRWYYWATHSRLEPVIKVAKTIKKHWDGILSWYTHRINNAILEGFNSLIQAAKARARGYRTTKNLITMVYLIAGKLNYKVLQPI